MSCAAPRLTTGPLRPVADPVAGTIAAVAAMDGTVLPIQGPPGTGKTYVTARAILSLVRQGARVGVTSNSHEAIRNVLMGCLSALEDADLPITLDLVHKTGGEDDGYPEDCLVRRTNSNDEAAGGRHVVGATAWFFTRDENVQAFDWLFVDEAGQVGLANMVAMGRAAKNIVLVGDPRQLPQVIQGAHPEPASLSCLEWMLGEDATVPPDRGIFLPVSRRMHPEVCRFISDQVYEGRLESHGAPLPSGPLPDDDGRGGTGHRDAVRDERTVRRICRAADRPRAGRNRAHRLATRRTPVLPERAGQRTRVVPNQARHSDPQGWPGNPCHRHQVEADILADR